jgi:two-component system OmpR family sensor kinase
LTSIYAAASLLSAPRSSLNDAERLDLLRDVAEEAERLLLIIEDLIVLAHVEGGIDTFLEPSLLQRLIPVAVERERRRWAGVAIELSVASPLPVVRSDGTAVQQVVRNLLSYAARSAGPGPIVVEVRPGEDGGVEVRVIDPSQGQALESQDQALEQPAASLPPVLGSLIPTWVVDGADVGLYVGSQLVGAMGGSLWLRRRDDGRRELGFWLPGYAEDEGPLLQDHPPDRLPYPSRRP